MVALTVHRDGAGSGTVSSSPGGIACGTSCAGTFARGSEVVLTAAPDGGSTFAGRSGACAGSSPTCRRHADGRRRRDRHVQPHGGPAADRRADGRLGALEVLHPKTGRRVIVMFRVSLAASARLRLLKGTRIVTGRTRAVKAGAALGQPGRAAQAHGRCSLQLRLKDGRGRVRTVTHRLTL